MPHGAPDWSNVVKYYQVHRLDDMAELAARLNTLHLWDRRGDVLFLEDFKNGLMRWGMKTSGTGASVEITTERYDSEGFSVKLIAGCDQDRLANISHYHPVPHFSTFGWEFCFTHHIDIEYIQLHGQHFLLGKAYVYDIRFNAPGKTLQYRDENEVWHDVLNGLELSTDDRLFHHLKLVVNFNKNQYERVIIDNNTVSLKDKYPPHYVDDYFPGVGIVIVVYSKPGFNAKSYIDSIIFTMNEPV